MIKNLKAAALGICTAALIGAGALGLAGTAAAATSTGPTGPGYSYSPGTHAHPAPTAKPGWHNNHGPARIANLASR
ncbi:hypothetical protein [Mycolicibacterium fluoranthenivorans]|uniref:Uncharacterized protein n=1 Tax=Mycolicibacterium fluoranthenivorans TaxID=258505 RepID=A0A1G4WWY9_9MYCO|nr:hypothetical protein [Mycolicibacterium fluoranthenivorans]SCX30400.1 hypothetical protein SAMN02799620_05048 [Mycolicibacterium fluoranthenivorans]